MIRTVLVATALFLFCGKAVADIEPKWGVSGITLTTTDSTKWLATLAPDGAGGVYLAWEDNRGRKVCCRDTRDIYAQWLGSDGAVKWGDADIKVAAEEAGEALLGLLSSGPDAGALVLWQRDGNLLAQVLDGAGKGLMPDGGTVLYRAAGVVDWNPGSGFAASHDGKLGLVVFSELAPGASEGVYVLAFEFVKEAWRVGKPTRIVAGPGLRGVTLAPCGNGGWLVCYWAVVSSGVELYGQWLMAGGEADGKPFLIGRDEDKKYVHVQASSEKAGTAFVLWAAVDPDAIDRTHEVMIVHLSRDVAGATAVIAGTAATARTMALYVSPVTVEVGNGMRVLATPAMMSWRRTSVVRATGGASALVGWISGEELSLRGVSVKGKRMKLSRSLKVSERVHGGLEPTLLPAGGASSRILWLEKDAVGSTALARRITVSRRGKVSWGGKAVPFLVDDAGSPRQATAKPAGNGDVFVGWSTSMPAGLSLLKVQKLIVSGKR